MCPGRRRGTTRDSTPEPGRAGRRSAVGDHVDRELEHHATDELDRHVVLADRLDGLLEDEVVTVD